MQNRTSKMVLKFIENCNKAPSLKNNQLLNDFMKIQDAKEFENILKQIKQEKGPQNIESFVTQEGQVSSQMSPEARDFVYSDRPNIFIRQYRTLFLSIGEINEQVLQK